MPRCGAQRRCVIPREKLDVMFFGGCVGRAERLDSQTPWAHRTSANHPRNLQHRPTPYPDTAFCPRTDPAKQRAGN